MQEAVDCRRGLGSEPAGRRDGLRTNHARGGSVPGKAGTAVEQGKAGTVPGKAALININTADEAQLTSLKGIGPTKAKAITQYRQAHGPFKTVDDLKHVSGIGDKTLGKHLDRSSLLGHSRGVARQCRAIPVSG